jgi:LPXTG-motif cell wall-anchored protein
MRVRKLLLASAVAVAAAGIGAAPVLAEDYTGTPDEGVLGTELTRGTAVKSASGARTLPVTGGDLVGLTAAGLASVAAGSVLVRRSRRTSTA